MVSDCETESREPQLSARSPARDTGFRRAASDDAAALARIHRLAFFDAMPHMPVLHTPEDDVAFFSEKVFGQREIWLTEDADTVTGFIAFRPGWIDHLYVLPGHQRCGRGGILLDIAKHGGHPLRLWTFQCNAGARAFYERHGFRIERETDGAANEERQPDVLYVWQQPG